MESVLEIGSIPCPDPIEGAGNLTLVGWAYLVAVVAVAPMVGVSWKSPSLIWDGYLFYLLNSTNSYVFPT